MNDYQKTTGFQHTAARRRLLAGLTVDDLDDEVSTHSRTEAAAIVLKIKPIALGRFNTQPHGGGCKF